MRAAATLFVCVYVLRALVAQMNSALSGVHIWLFVDGLFLVYASLMARFWQGFAVAAVAGMVCDALTPVTFGTHTVLFTAAHGFVYNVRERVQREDTVVRIGVALAVNLGLFVALSLLRVRAQPLTASVWPRMLSDLLLSEGLIAVIGAWFFALQERALALVRARTERPA